MEIKAVPDNLSCLEYICGSGQVMEQLLYMVSHSSFDGEALLLGASILNYNVASLELGSLHSEGSEVPVFRV